MAGLSLAKLRTHLGDDYPLVKLRERLRCEQCRSRLVVITFLAPNQRTGNLVQLFNRKPGGGYVTRQLAVMRESQC